MVPNPEHRGVIMEDRRVLVTGASGFLGANLVRKLIALGHSVTAAVRPTSNLWRLAGVLSSVRLVQVDLLEAENVRRIVQETQPEAIVHLAGSRGHPQTLQQRLDALQTSVIGTAAVLEAADCCDVRRFVHVGSSLEYRRQNRPLCETDPLEPDTYRGLSRLMASQLVQHEAAVRGINAVIVRPFSVYGPWEAPHRFIPTLIRAALAGDELPLTAHPAQHDWIHVEDVAELIALLLHAEVEPGEVFNAGTGVQWDNLAVVRLFERGSGLRVRIRAGAHPPSPADRPCWVADMTRCRERLGWQPRWRLGDGLRHALQWWGARCDFPCGAVLA